MKTLIENEIKCGLSEGCLQSIFSLLGYKLSKVALEDDCGVDYNLKKRLKIKGKFSDLGSVLDFQLKATENWNQTNDKIIYQLRNKSLNDLIARNVEKTTKLIFLLHCLPNVRPWLEINKDFVAIRENIYWYETSSAEYVEKVDSKTTIYIPIENRLTVSEIDNIVKKWAIQ